MFLIATDSSEIDAGADDAVIGAVRLVRIGARSWVLSSIMFLR
jgi:hypothetical protein